MEDHEDFSMVFSIPNDDPLLNVLVESSILVPVPHRPKAA
jgi:hypothetical protein